MNQQRSKHKTGTNEKNPLIKNWEKIYFSVESNVWLMTCLLASEYIQQGNH